jgi:hypothetical protein
MTCKFCNGKLEAAARVYFDIETRANDEGESLEITALDYSDVNDEYRGHPVALEAEFNVSCVDCGHDFTDFGFAIDIVEAINFQGLRV